MQAEEQLHAETGDLGHGVHNGVHPLQARELVEADKERVAGGGPAGNHLHFIDDEPDHHPQPAGLFGHIRLGQGQVKAHALLPRLQVRQLEVGISQAALQRFAIQKLGVAADDLQDALVGGRAWLPIQFEKHQSRTGNLAVVARVVGDVHPEQLPGAGRFGSLLDELGIFRHLAMEAFIAVGDEAADREQVAALLEMRRSQDMQNDRLEHLPGRFIPKGIGAVAPNDQGFCKPAHLVGSEFVGRVNFRQRVEPAAQLAVHGGDPVGVDHMDGLSHAFGELGTGAAPGGGHGGVLALGVDDHDQTGPEAEIVDDDGGSLAAAAGAEQTDMAVVRVTQRNMGFYRGPAQPEGTWFEAPSLGHVLGIGPLGGGKSVGLGHAGGWRGEFWGGCQRHRAGRKRKMQKNRHPSGQATGFRR